MKITWHPEILTDAGRDLLPSLAQVKELEDFYLVGGTALSLYLGHRESIDFDFFTKTNFRNHYITSFRKISENTELSDSEISWQILVNNNSALEFILNDVKIFLWENHYPLVGEINSFRGLNVASLVDIGLLKLIAVGGRTTWKDIIDLYFFHKDVMTIKELLQKYNEIYPNDSENIYQSVITHLNLKELKKSPYPKMIKAVDFKAAFEMVSELLIVELQTILVK